MEDRVGKSNKNLLSYKEKTEWGSGKSLRESH